MKYTMQLISRDELKRKLEHKDHFKLAMALGTWDYRVKHIPGSLHFLTPEDALASLAQDDEIVVYCSSKRLYRQRLRLRVPVRHSYKHVRR